MAGTQRIKTQKQTGDVTITILHVSDMQFGRNHRFGRLGLGGADEKFDTLLKRLTDDLDKLRDDQGLKPDLVALTGDLAEWGKKKEFDDVYHFCVGLQAHLKLGRDRILVIPGNHDINRKLCESYFAECDGNDEEPKEPYWPKWKPFVEFFGKLYKDVERYEFKETAPYTWFDLPELKIVVAGLNSTMRESHKEKDPSDPHSVFGHYGYVGEAQLGWFKEKLDEADRKGWLRIGLVHHNAVREAANDDENLRDAPLLKDRIGAKLNLLLHGHTHNGSLGWLDRDLPAISTGSAAVKIEQRPEEVPNQYQIIQVRRDGFTNWARQYTPAQRKWIADPRISSDGYEGRHEQEVSLPNTHGTFGAREPHAARRKGSADTDGEDGPPQERHVLQEREQTDLLAEMMAFCRVRDESKRVETMRISGYGQWRDYCRVTDPRRGTYLLGAHAGPLTLDVLDRWVKDVHEPYRSRGNAGRTSDLVIESADAFTDEVKARAGQAGVQIYRRIDYENIIDTERWKQQQLARIDREPDYRSDLYIEQRATLRSPVDEAKTTIHPAADSIVDLLCGHSGCFVLVLGAAGTGKTFLLREVARRMTARQSAVTPIIVELRGLDRALDVYQLVNWEFARGASPLTLPAPAFEQSLYEGRIALLFDGFDELANRVRSAAIPEHFGRILNAARDRARVLLTSREEHFVSRNSAIEVFSSTGGLAGQLHTLPQRRLVVTEKFTNEQIEAYLSRALGSAAAGKQRMERFRQVHDLPGLAATPRMLTFLVQLTEAQLAAAAAEKGKAITPTELYRIVIVDLWLAQQEARLNPPGSAPGPTRDALLESVQRLALRLWRSMAKSIAATDLEVSTGEQLLRLCEGDTAVARQMLQGRTLLVHGEDGQLTFVHQTVMEWLVGQALAARIQTGNADGDLDTGRLSDFLIDVLRDLLGDDQLAEWANGTLNAAPASRLAENARLTLSRMKRQAGNVRADLRGQNFRGQLLTGQNLRGALLDNADLRGVDLAERDLTSTSLRCANLARADLRGAILTDANLEGADLSFARLDRAIVSGARWSKAVLLAMHAIGIQGGVEQAGARFSESAAWSASSTSRTLWPVPSASGCLTVAFSPDGHLLVTGHSDGLVRIWEWEVEHASLLRVMEGHTDSVKSVAFSPDGTRLATGSADKTVRLWDVATGQTVHTIEGKMRSITSVAFSPNGLSLAAGASDNAVRVWDVATGKLIHCFDRHKRSVSSVAFSPDSKCLASGSSDMMVFLYDLATEKLLHSFSGHANRVNCVSISPDGTKVASGSEDKTLRMWDLLTRRQMYSFEGHTRSIMSVTFSPDGTRLATGAADNIVRLFDAATGKLLRAYEGHTRSVMSVAFSPEGTKLASGSSDQTVRLWTVAEAKSFRTLDESTRGIVSVSFAPTGRRLTSGSEDRLVRLWDVATGKVLSALDGHTDWVLSVSCSPDGRRIASGSADGTVRLWDAATGKMLLALKGHTNGVTSVAFSPDGHSLASSSADTTVRTWSVNSGQVLRQLEGHTKGVKSISFSSDGLRIASGSSDNTVRLWDLVLEKYLVLDAHTTGVNSVSFAPDGLKLASGSSDNTVCMWETETGRLLRTMGGHTNVISSVSFSPDGKRLASGSSDNTVRLWNGADGKPLQVLRGHLGPVLSVCWHHNGRFLVSSGSDGTMRIWDTGSSECLAVYVCTPNGSVVYRPRDGRYRSFGDPAGRVAYTIGLARYELGELDEFVEGGLRLRDDERLVPA